MATVTVGIDLAKNVFAVPGINESGKAILIRLDVKRAALPRWHGGMEACSGVYHWALDSPSWVIRPV